MADLTTRPIQGGALLPVVVVNPAGGGVANPTVNANIQLSGTAVSSTTPVPVTGPFLSVEVTLALDTSAYSIGDVFSNTIEVPHAVRTAGGRSLLHHIIVYDFDDQGFGIDLLPLRANVSLGTRNLAPTISDATAINILGYVRIGASDFYDLGGMRVAEAATVGRMVEAAAGSTSIFLGSLVQGAGTYTASGVKVRLNFIPE